jgi:extracellular factor (EF) 3-hydroxypalmitic acid methyl ester biosynthesis protein
MPTLTAEKLAEINTAVARVAMIDSVDAMVNLGEISEGLNTLFNGLMEARENMDHEDWAAFGRYFRSQHPLRHALYQDPMTRRAFFKPRGYAGDAVMMDYLYGIHHSDQVELGASEIGREVYHYIQQRPAGQAVRFRREHIAQMIDRLAADKPSPAVLAIASGHLREAELSTALATGAAGRFVALDADPDSLREVETRYAHLGVETVHGSVRHILARKVKLGTFDFVYAAGLYDYLNDAVAQALTARMFELTNPGGQLLVPNFAPTVKDRAYMETYMDWDLIYRDEYDMAKLLERIDPTQIESYEIYTDPSNSVVYLLIKKASA